MTPEEQAEARALVRRMIELIGDDPAREGLVDTPDRVVRSWAELFAGYGDDCSAYERTFASSEDDQIVVLRNIEVFSTCEHHMIPFHGHASVAYLPADGRVLGVSKLARIVNAKARKLQIQERLTREIADAVEELASPRGVAVVVNAVHLCMSARGVRQHDSSMLTSRVTGIFREDDKARAEVMGLIKDTKGAG